MGSGFGKTTLVFAMVLIKYTDNKMLRKYYKTNATLIIFMSMFLSIHPMSPYLFVNENYFSKAGGKEF